MGIRIPSDYLKVQLDNSDCSLTLVGISKQTPISTMNTKFLLVQLRLNGDRSFLIVVPDVAKDALMTNNFVNFVNFLIWVSIFEENLDPCFLN